MLLHLCVYAGNSFSKRQNLWDLLRLDASIIRSPWLTMGDFNNALNIKDKNGSFPIPFSYLNSFRNCLFNCGLVTWQRRGIATNIDKVLINYEFLSMFPHFSTIALPTCISDHTPIILTCYILQHQRPKSAPFRYANNWCYSRGYDHCIAKVIAIIIWGSCFEKLIYKLKAVKVEIKKLIKLRASENHISRLQIDFDTVCHQTDQDPENITLYDTMFQMGQNLNEQIHRQLEFL